MGAEGAICAIVVADGSSVWFMDRVCVRGRPIRACSDFHDRFNGGPGGGGVIVVVVQWERDLVDSLCAVVRGVVIGFGVTVSDVG